MLGLDRFGTNHSEAARRTVDPVPALERVGIHCGRCLDQFPHGVLAGSGQPGVIHHWVCRQSSALAAPGLVLTRTLVSEQLKGAQLLFCGERNVLNIRLSGGNPQHREAEQKSQEAQGEVQIEIGILPLISNNRML